MALSMVMAAPGPFVCRSLNVAFSAQSAMSGARWSRQSPQAPECRGRGLAGNAEQVEEVDVVELVDAARPVSGEESRLEVAGVHREHVAVLAVRELGRPCHGRGPVAPPWTDTVTNSDSWPMTSDEPALGSGFAMERFSKDSTIASLLVAGLTWITWRRKRLLGSACFLIAMP
jgi:hypothetical protein